MNRTRTAIHPGEIHGELTAVRRIPQDADRPTRWLCRCSCGNEKIVVHFRTSPVLSCGCKTPTGRKYIRSGQSTQAQSLYFTWHNMMKRCHNPNNASFKDYGGRGISVCDRWKTFANFLADMGDRPDGKSVDRINNDGNYEPTNCRWATWRQQALNRRKADRDELTGRFKPKEK